MERWLTPKQLSVPVLLFLSAASAVAQPVIENISAVDVIFSTIGQGQPNIAQRGWAQIFGEGFVDDGSGTGNRVFVNDVETIAFTDSVSNVYFQIPAQTPLGHATFKVSTDGVMSAPFSFPVSAVAPAQSVEFGDNFHLNGAIVAELNPASPGETVISTFITGLGVPQPPQLTLTLGGLPAAIVSLQENVGEFPAEGLWELEWTVPQGLGTGLHPVTLSVGGVSFTDNDFLFVGSGGLQADPVVEDAVNLASHLRLLSPGVQAIIFGQNLTTQGTCLAGVSPLPTELCGTRVLVDDIPSPILKAVSDFVEVVLPFDLNPGSSEVVVETGGILLSEPFQVTLETHAPGIFLNDDNGFGLFVNALTSTTVTQESPVEPGDILWLRAVGLGPTDPPVAAGDPAPFSPIAVTVTTPTITIGEGTGTAAVTTPKQQSLAAQVVSSGLFPGSTGTYIVTFSVPAGLPDGLLPLTLEIGGQVSNTVLLPVGQSATPSISAGGIVLATLLPTVRTVSPLSIISVFGENFSTETILFPNLDSQGKLDNILGGTCLMMNGEALPIFAITPGQINAQASAAKALGPANFTVVTNCGTAGATSSAPLTIELSPTPQALTSDVEVATIEEATPGFFLFPPLADDGLIAARFNADAIAVAPDGMFTDRFGTSRPAMPGEIIVLYGTGWGETTAGLTTGELASGAAELLPEANAMIMFGGVVLGPDDVLYIGVTPQTAGLVQAAIRVPAGAQPGNNQVVLTVYGKSTPVGPVVPVALP